MLLAVQYSWNPAIHDFHAHLGQAFDMALLYNHEYVYQSVEAILDLSHYLSIHYQLF
jgi:hypothetical protein